MRTGEDMEGEGGRLVKVWGCLGMVRVLIGVCWMLDGREDPDCLDGRQLSFGIEVDGLYLSVVATG